MQAITVIEQFKEIGIKEISKNTVKDWFAYRPHINCTIKEIINDLEKAGIKIKPCKTQIPVDYMPIVPEIEFLPPKLFTKQDLIDLYVKQDLTVPQICKLKNCVLTTVYSALREFKIPIKERNTGKSRIIKDMDKIIEMNKSGTTLKEIAKLNNYNVAVLSETLRENGYYTKKKYNKN